MLNQARAIRLAKTEGHRCNAFELLNRAEQLQSSFGTGQPNDAPLTEGLPTKAELRTAALASLLHYDGQLEQSNSAMYQAVDPTSNFVGLLEVAAGNPPAPKLRVLRLADNEQVAELNVSDSAKDFASPNFALSASGIVVAKMFMTEIRLFDTAKGESLASLVWPTESDGDRRTPVISLQPNLAFSPDGKYLTAFRSQSGKGESALWELPPNFATQGDQDEPTIVDGELLAHSRAALLATPCFDALSIRVAFPVSERKIAVRNLADESILEFEIAEPWTPFGPLAFSPDGNSIALTIVREQPRNSALLVWDLDSNSEKHRIVTGQRVWFSPPRISPDGKFIATGTPEGAVVIFDLQRGSMAVELDHGGAVRDVGWSNNSQLWSTAAGAMKRWQLALERPLRTVRTQAPGNFASVRFQFSPNANRLVTATGRSKLHVYSWPEAQLQRTLETPMRSVMDICLDSEGRTAVVTGMADPTGSARALATMGVMPTTIAQFNLDTGEKVFEAEQKVALASSIDNRGAIRFLRRDGSTLQVTDIDGNSFLWTKTVETPMAGMSPIGVMDSSGRRIAIWVAGLLPNSPNPPLQVWDIDEDRRLFIDEDAGDDISAALFSNDGSILVTTHADNVLAGFGQSTADVTGTVCVRDAASGEMKLEVKGPEVLAAALSPNGELAAIQFADRHIELWDVDESEKLFNWNLPKAESSLLQQSHLEFTPDGCQLAVVVDANGVIELLDFTRVQELLKPIGLAW